MVAISADRVRKLNIRQIHDLALSQYEFMSTPEYRELKNHTDHYRGSELCKKLTEAFYSTSEATVVEDYALDAILMAAIAEEHRTKFTDDELKLLSQSWEQLFRRNKEVTKG